MTRRYAYGWFHLLKDAGANAVRLHASVYPFVLSRHGGRDGIMILDESRDLVSDGGPKADTICSGTIAGRTLKSWSWRDRNHPSVLAVSVCNEILPVLRNVWHAPTNMVTMFR